MQIDSRLRKGVKWTTLSTIAVALVAVLKVSILARYLEKADFGLMALALFVIGFVELFNDMGITTAILSRQEITKKEYASLYWINWIISFLMYSILCLIGPLAAKFYNEEDLVTLFPLIGSSLVISAIGKQYRTMSQKQLDFSTISIVEIVCAILSLVIAVILAVKHYGVYSLVYSVLFQLLSSNIFFLIYGIRKYGILLYFNFNKVLPFFRIGIYQVGAQFINYFNRDIDILIIGKFFGAEILGGYSLARDLVRKPSSFIVPIVNRVASAALAKVNHDKNILKEYYLKTTNYLASITIPVYLGIIIFAYPAVWVLYGEKFLNITVLVQILAVNMVFRVIGGNVGNLVIATGRTDLDFKWNFVTLAVTPACVYFGSFFGINYVALFVSLSMVVLFIPSYQYLIKSIIDVSLREYSRAFFIVNIKQLFVNRNARL